MSVSDGEFQQMLADVLACVSPEVIEEMRKGAGPDRSGLYIPSKTAIRSKRWREGKVWAGNPFHVQVGQYWLRVGKSDSASRLVKVLEVGSTHAIVSSGLRKSRIRLDRFTPSYQGYELVEYSDRWAS